MSAKTLEARTIKQCLIEEGIEEELALCAQQVACYIRDSPSGEASRDSILQDRRARQQGIVPQVNETLLLLTEGGYVLYDINTERYGLTEIGMATFSH